ncbi:MAG: hypothetical protein EBT61_08025 [Verrucomicrobia bacterium]|nr:hypothetical protein [Verrucomicrobiota bacterium]
MTDGEAPTPFAPSFQFVFGDGSYFSGSSPMLTATVIGSFPLSYQWLKNSMPIPNATNATLPLPGIQLADAGTYTIVVTNVAGAISSNLTVSVTASTPPVITTQPTNQVVLSNSTVQLTVAATGTVPLSYQWRKGGVNLTTNAVTFGINTAQLTIYNFSDTNAGDYTVVITNYAGSVTSAVATISILQVTTPVFLTQPPPVISILTNAPFTINTVVAGTPTPALQWQKNNVNIPGATNAIFNGLTTNYNGGGSFRLIAANLNGSATSAVCVVNVYDRNLYYNNPAPTNAVLPAGGTLRQRASAYGMPPVFFTLRKDGLHQPAGERVPRNLRRVLRPDAARPPAGGQWSLLIRGLQHRGRHGHERGVQCHDPIHECARRASASNQRECVPLHGRHHHQRTRHLLQLLPGYGAMAVQQHRSQRTDPLQPHTRIYQPARLQPQRGLVQSGRRHHQRRRAHQHHLRPRNAGH